MKTYMPQMPVKTNRNPVREIPEMGICILPRGTTGFVRIGSLIEPLRQVMNYPDRNRLMAELFKDYKKDYK